MGPFPSSDFGLMGNIGRGAYGVVDKAFDLKSCRIVAVKRSRSAQQKMMNSLKKEVVICREFASTPQIVEMVSFGRDRRRNELCIALEYMDCGSLRNKSSFTLPEVKWISVSVLKALRALHSKLMVHNDVKPDNILFDSRGAVKLTDFGCVKQMESESTPLTEPVGSLRFQSYEKKFLSPIRYTTKSDLYSFGITVAEILNGSHIEEETKGDPEQKSNEDDPEQIPYKIPQSVRDQFGGDPENAVIDFLEKCLEKNFNRRFNADQLLKHPFLREMASDSSPATTTADIVAVADTMFADLRTERIDDLQSMTEMLIEYYLNYNKSRRPSVSQKEKGVNFEDLSRTPIDDEFSDSQRIQNIALYSGFSVEKVQEYIYQSVNDVKNQYLRR